MKNVLFRGFSAHHGSLGSARRIAVGAVFAGVVIGCGGTKRSAGGVPDSAASASMAPDPDVRTAVVLSAQGRNLILEEMRGMLSSVQGFVAAAAVGDTAAMRTAAEASGVAAARDMDPAMAHSLPVAFEDLGMSTHMAWDSLALAVGHGTPTNQALAGLGKIMANCVACHTQFRINVQH